SDGKVVVLGRFKGNMTTYGGTQSAGLLDWQNFVTKISGDLTLLASGGWFKKWGIRFDTTALNVTRTINGSSEKDETIYCGTCATPLSETWRFKFSINGGNALVQNISVVPGASQSVTLDYHETRTFIPAFDADVQDCSFPGGTTDDFSKTYSMSA